MFTIFRRHESSCHYKQRGRTWTKCQCPIWCDGQLLGKRVRKSLDTRDWARARRNLSSVEDPTYGLRECAQSGCGDLVESGRCQRHVRTVAAAIVAYHDAHQDVGMETKRTRRRALRFLQEFLEGRKIQTVNQIDLDALNTFRSTRTLSPRTWIKELEILRHFLRFCLDNEWVARNWAQKVHMPKNLKPAPREPYEPNEIAKIIAACDGIGKGAYERLRARTMVLLLRYTALRISDVAMLRRDRIGDGEVFLRTAKNGKPVKLPVHPDLQAALDMLPLPRGAREDCPYFFWSGNGTVRSLIRTVTETMTAVYKASGVLGASSHRFRHTLATEVLEMGGTLGEAADILGDSEAIVRKHYAKWSNARQARISDLLARIWHAKKSSPQRIEKEWIRVVPGVGLEPTLPLPEKGF
jgi:site-specific recombinase XerD